MNEDDALKAHLRGVAVRDDRGESKVGVWFRFPDPEERAVTYPFITIDFVRPEKETDREQRGYMKLEYVPEGYEDPGAGFGQTTETPIPVSLMYQITSYARSAWHARQIQAQLLGNKLPFRYGSLYVPADDTVRRLDLLDTENMDGLDSNNKRVFRTAYTVAVSSQLFPELVTAVQQAASVQVTTFHQLEPFIIEADAA
jgi:hypothetical protein